MNKNEEKFLQKMTAMYVRGMQEIGINAQPDYEKVKKSICVRLKKADAPGTCATVLNDFGVSIGICLNNNQYGSTCASISPLSEEEFEIAMRIAKENEEKIFGKFVVEDMITTMKNLMADTEINVNLDDVECNSTYVATNESRMNGATIILFPEIMQNIAKKIGNFYILPSSIHEVIIVPESFNSDHEELLGMVESVNGNEEIMRKEDVLSNTVLYFDSPNSRFLKVEKNGFSFISFVSEQD